MATKLLVKEIYYSIQGESTWAGLPCLFIRLSGCDLRCSYCDSVYAFRGGTQMSVDEVVAETFRLTGSPVATAAGANMPLVELTGGEPLLQSLVHPLMDRLCDEGFKVLIETSGAHDISPINKSVSRIVDLKCPSSGESDRIRWENLDHLKPSDELKFVITSLEDYEWAKEKISRYKLSDVCPLLFSSVAPLTKTQQSEELKVIPPTHTVLSREALVDRLIEDRLPVRFQLQMHKFIWPPDQTGV